MMNSVFPIFYILVLLLLLLQAFRVMFKGWNAANNLDQLEKKPIRDRTGRFTIHPELLNEQGEITDEDLLTVRFSNDLDHPKQTESSSE